MHHRLGSSLRALSASVAISLLPLTGIVAGSVTASASVQSPPAVAASVYGFSSPDAAVAVGAVLLVANSGNNSITLINGISGGFLGRIAGSAYGFSHPDALAVVPSMLVVANRTGSSLTVIDLHTRRFVRRIAAASMADPIALTTYGSLVVELSGLGRVIVVDPARGTIVRVIAGVGYHFARPTSITVAAGHAFVTNQAGASVTMIDLATGHLLRVIAGGAYGFAMPTGATSVGSSVWVTNWSNSSITALSAATGSFIHHIVNGNFVTPGPVTAGDGYLYTASPPGWSPMVTQVTLATLSVNWMMCNTNYAFNFNSPQALVVIGHSLWVSNMAGNSLSQMNAISGVLVRDLV